MSIKSIKAERGRIPAYSLTQPWRSRILDNESTVAWNAIVTG
jgi:hypothetical protein